MNNDLISRDALKKAFKSWKTMDDYYHDTDCKDIPLSEAFDLIDSAPTVEPEITDEDLQAGMTESWHLGYELAEVKFKRPQGEWIDRIADKGYVECPFCHKQITGGDLNFCVKCGADMRGGAE